MITARLLSGLELFSSLRQDELAHLAVRAADIHLVPGSWLAREGERLAFFVILGGALELTKEIEGRTIHVTDYHAGEFFGEVNALFGIPALSSLRAKTVCRVAAFEPQQLQELIQKHAECRKIIFESLEERFSGAPRHAATLPSVRVRLIGRPSDPLFRLPLAFLKSNRIPYGMDEGAESGCGCSDPALSLPALLIDGKPLEQPWTARAIADAYGLATRPLRPHYDVVIVGGGPAGLAAAVYGASEGLRVLLVEQWAMGGQAGTSSRIENYLGFPSGVSGEDLSERAVRQAEKFGAELILIRSVTSLDRMRDSNYRVILDGEEEVTAESIILATGVRWRALEADGVERLHGKGVSYGAGGIEPSSLSGKRVFIVGGGNSAGQAAISLANYARSVTLLVRGEGLSSSMSQYLIEQLQSKSNIQVETGTSVLSVHGENTLRAICTVCDGMESSPRKADALYIMIGADAKTDWLPQDLQISEDGFICTGLDICVFSSCWPHHRNPFLLETGLPGVFCAGDVRHGSMKRVSSAVGEGSMAIAFVHQFLALKREAQIPSSPSQLDQSCQLSIIVNDIIPTSTNIR